MAFKDVAPRRRIWLRARFSCVVRPRSKEPTIVTITHKVAIELPLPPNSVRLPFRFERRRCTPEEVAPSAFFSNDRSAPPVRQRDGRIGICDSLISVRRKKVVVILRVVMKEDTDLPQIVHALRALPARLRIG